MAYHPETSIPSLAKVAMQFQAVREETDFLDLFQSIFRPGFGTALALVIMTEDLHKGIERCHICIFIFFDLLEDFSTIDYVVFF